MRDKPILEVVLINFNFSVSNSSTIFLVKSVVTSNHLVISLFYDQGFYTTLSSVPNRP